MGHIVSGAGVKPIQERSIRGVLEPRNVKETFLGTMMGYYPRFIPHLAGMTDPLTVMLKKREKVLRRSCKAALCSAPEFESRISDDPPESRLSSVPLCPRSRVQSCRLLLQEVNTGPT